MAETLGIRDFPKDVILRPATTDPQHENSLAGRRI
jgi:hypothetical protein